LLSFTFEVFIADILDKTGMMLISEPFKMRYTG